MNNNAKLSLQNVHTTVNALNTVQTDVFIDAKKIKQFKVTVDNEHCAAQRNDIQSCIFHINIYKSFQLRSNECTR